MTVFPRLPEYTGKKAIDRKIRQECKKTKKPPCEIAKMQDHGATNWSGAIDFVPQMEYNIIRLLDRTNGESL